MNIARTILFLIALQSLSICIWAQGVHPAKLEHHIKAVFLYKFSSYVEWPPSTFDGKDVPFVIGVIGAQETAEELEDISAEYTVNGRKVEIRRFRPRDRLSDAHLLFVGRKESAHLQAILSRLQSEPVLIVTESKGALAEGSIVNFVPVDRNIRFEISLVNADLNGITISSRLLDVAHRVELGR